MEKGFIEGTKRGIYSYDLCEDPRSSRTAINITLETLRYR